MPWKETGPVHERMRFIEAYLTGFYTITELAARYGISRRIAHKWLSRHDANGAAGLQDRSRAPINIPYRTTDDIAAKIVAFRRRFPIWGRVRSPSAWPNGIRTSSGRRRAPSATSCSGPIW